jgi:DNA-directed RNA polymerase specialized sigma24 family protein
MIRKHYSPPRTPAGGAREELAEAVCAGRLTADALLTRYCTLVYAETESYQETARRLGLDRRTVRARVDRALLARLRGEPPEPKAAR